MSHPSWVRGLKHKNPLGRVAVGLSHPSWVRGLKHRLAKGVLRSFGRTPRGCVD